MTNEERALHFFTKYPGHLKTATSDIANRLDISKRKVTQGRALYRKGYRRERHGEIVKVDELEKITNSNDSVEKEVERSGKGEEYQEFLDKHGINREDVTNVYFKEKASGTHFTVQVRKQKEELDFDPTEEFKKAIKEYKPSFKTNTYDTFSNRCAVINLFDAHLGKISSVDVTDSKRTVNDNVDLFEEAFFDLYESIRMKQPEKIIFPVGNDLFHVNDDSLSTKKGTFLGNSMGISSADEFRLGLNIIRNCIERLSEIAPVEVITVRGNHDSDKVLYLLECLLIAFEDHPNVNIHDSRKTRQYYRYGQWLFGFAHGDRQRKAKDLPSLMSTDEDSRKHWSDIKRGVYFLGDLHHERRYDYRGCTVMYLRSISTTDEWHWENGFTAIPKTAYAFIYDKNGKREQEFKVSI